MNEFVVLEDSKLSEYMGGVICSVIDVECWGWPLVKRVGGMISTGPTRPTTCIPKGAWNPAAPVPCP